MVGNLVAPIDTVKSFLQLRKDRQCWTKQTSVGREARQGEDTQLNYEDATF